MIVGEMNDVLDQYSRFAAEKDINDNIAGPIGDTLRLYLASCNHLKLNGSAPATR